MHAFPDTLYGFVVNGGDSGAGAGQPDNVWQTTEEYCFSVFLCLFALLTVALPVLAVVTKRLAFFTVVVIVYA